MSIFGDLERLLADLYPYRVPVTLAAAAVIAAAAILIARRGWHRPPLRWASANRLPAAVIGGASAVVVLSVGYYLLSPLWERTTLIEASPLDTVVATALGDDPTATATAVASETPSSSTTGATPSPTPTTEAVGSATAATGPRLVSSGGFQGADSFHFAEGDALIVETAPDQFVLRFENFSIRNGPDLYVYLSADPQQPSQDAIRLGGLKATDGAFNYEIPAGTDISALTHAMVWCDRFAVLFANASLVP